VTSRYGEAGPGPKDSVMIQTFQLIGHEFIALNGGPVKGFIFNESILFFVYCKTEEEISKLFKILSDGGEILIPLDKYPFSEKFVWFNDRYRISWQLSLAKHNQKITPLLWFENHADEAMNYYTSVISGIGGNDSGIKSLSRFGVNENGPAGKVQHATFTLNGQEYMAMDGNKKHFTPAISLLINCDTQKEVDELWEKLSTGGKTSQCGWLTDKFGVTWQIVPTILGKLMSDPDLKKSQRVMKAMLKMTKIESDILKKAYEEA
jgi:predicted 3-demethylubiquinone-9 3-methyltransferase (glyoxalase superfamily)